MRLLAAVLMLSGMIIGVGMFGIPFSFFQSGFLIGMAELMLLAVAVTTLHVAYGEVVLATPGQHRLPGYARLYLGRWAEKAALFGVLFGIIGTLLAYLLIGSVFLHNLTFSFFPESDEFLWASLMTLAGLVILRAPLKRGALINGILTAILIAFIGALAVILLPRIDAANFSGVRWENGLVPYGVLLFSLAGGTVVPDVVSYLGRQRFESRMAILAGSLIPAFVYALFAAAVLGASGEGVSREAIAGLAPIAGEWVVRLGSGIGFLAVFTSYIVLVMSFRALLRLDLGWGPEAAWLAAGSAPYLAYLLGFSDFIRIIGLVGTVAVGIDGALVIAMYIRTRRRQHPSAAFLIWMAFIFLMLSAGIGYEVMRFVGVW